MNADLKRRLTPFKRLTKHERAFLDALEDRFINETASVVKYVSVSYEPIESKDDDTAYVDLEDDCFELVLDDRLSFGTVCDYLIHEFAHIGTWFVNEKEHGPHFGVEWARLYCIYLNMYDKHFWPKG
jgi:hypothetical protein